MSSAALAGVDVVFEEEELPSVCEECKKPPGDLGLERCHICKKALCQNCDIRGKIPEKAACWKHS